MIYTSTKSKSPKRKPGWQAAAKQEADWLKELQSMQLSSSNRFKPTSKANQVVGKSPVVDGTTVGQDRVKVGQSLGEFGGVATKKVVRPEIEYKDDPEMLARELRARERKFNTAPAYNKGNDVFISDEMMKDITAGLTRRR